MADPPGDATDENPARVGKVARLIDRYGLEGIGDELAAGWTAVGRNHRSLRDLAEAFNRRILRATMTRNGVRPVEGELENVHRLLTEDTVSRGDSTRVRRRLERNGIDVDALLDDFVSYQSVRTYLREVRGVEYAPDDDDRTGSDRRSLEKLQGRLEMVTRDKIEIARRSDRLLIGEFDVLVDVSITCGDCGARYNIVELFQSGGCSCRIDVGG